MRNKGLTCTKCNRPARSVGLCKFHADKSRVFTDAQKDRRNELQNTKRNKNRQAIRLADRRYQYKRKYGITLEQYEDMLKDQYNKCKVCGVHKDDLSYNLNVDHNHRTGKVRGLLCYKCNVSLGLVNDDINLFYKLLEYLFEDIRSE